MQDPPEIQDVLVNLETKLPVCRVCLNISMEYIEFDSTLCLVNGLEISYSDGFNFIVPDMVDVPTDLMKTFCSSCGSDLLNAYLFRKRVENANIILNQINDLVEESPTNVESAYNVEAEIKGCTKLDEKDTNDELFDRPKTFLQIEMPMLISKEHIQSDKMSKLIQKKIKVIEFDEPWPEITGNSLYTDYESDLLIDDTDALPTINQCNEVQDEKTNKLKEPIIWMCKDCGEVCISKEVLQIHRRKHQIENRSETKCRKCKRTFKNVEEFDSHLGFHQFSEFTSENTGKSNFRCKLCDRKYSSEVDFIDHLNIHKDKKPHICKECGKTFHTIHMQQLHTFRIHKNALKKTLKCKKTNCGKKEKCSHCCKMVRKSFLEIHNETHFGSKISVCMECGKKNSRRNHTWNVKDIIL